MIKNFINEKLEKLQKEKNAIIFTVINDSRVLRTFSIKNFMRFFEFVRYKKDDKSFILSKDYDDDNWTNFALLINDIRAQSATKFKKSKKIKDVNSTKNAKSIKEVKKTSEKDLWKNKSIKTTKARQDNNDQAIIAATIIEQ